MMIESRREYTSATMPVGISNTNAEISNVVPTSTSCTGVSPATVASYNDMVTNIIEKKAEAVNSMNRYTVVGVSFFILSY
jgi:hypothetical protein